MNRRAFLGGLAGMAGALVLPASVTENAAEARRWWALGAMPGRMGLDADEIAAKEAIWSEWFDAGAGWDIVPVRYVIHVDRSPYLGLHYVKAPRRKNTVSVREEWVE